jgi:hypothetical protein
MPSLAANARRTRRVLVPARYVQGYATLAAISSWAMAKAPAVATV